MIRKIALPVALFALALTAPVASASTGLVGEWRLNEGSGTVVADSSGFDPPGNGTLSDGVSWTSGPGGSALSFNGTTGQVRVLDVGRFEPSKTVSVAAWVARVGSPGDYRYIVSKGATGCIAASYGLYTGPNGGLMFYVNNGNGFTYTQSPDAGANVWDGRWHLVVGTYDGNAVHLYVDGAEIGSGTPNTGRIVYGDPNGNDLFIGAYPSCTNEDFNGTLSDVRIWNRALSAPEISALMAPAQPPPTGGGNPPSTAPAAGGAAANGGGSGATGTGAGTPQSSPPVIGMVSMSSSTLTVGSGAPGGRSTPLITYNDSGSSRVTFTILQVQSKAMQARCTRAARSRHRNPVGHCPRLVALGRFVHQDHRGHNTVRFPRALTPSPGNYVLDVTPSLGGTVGKTLSIAFKVIARR
jgi:hypothetical protein